MSRRIHPGAERAPMPATLEDAHAEILYLRSVLIRERAALATRVEAHERDRRSARGQLRVLAREVARLRGGGGTS